MPTLTTEELASWIEKRTATPAAESNMHLWDWQAMCHLKAELTAIKKSVADHGGPDGHIDWLEGRSERLTDVEAERAKASDANAKRFYEQSERRLRYITECQQLLGTHDNLQTAIEKLIQERDQWCEAYDEQIRLNLLDKAELVRLRETLAEVRKQLAEAQTYL